MGFQRCLKHGFLPGINGGREMGKNKNTEILPVLEFYNLRILNSIINIGGILSCSGGCHMGWQWRPAGKRWSDGVELMVNHLSFLWSLVFLSTAWPQLPCLHYPFSLCMYWFSLTEILGLLLYPPGFPVSAWKERMGCGAESWSS